MYVQTYTGEQRGRKKTAMEQKKTSTRHPDPKRKRDKH
jgi:hypothetical protein